MGPKEDCLIREMSVALIEGVSETTLIAMCQDILEEYEPLVEKAHWAYAYASRECNRPVKYSKQEFCEEHRSAWLKFFKSAAECVAHKKSNVIKTEMSKRSVTCAAHFPELPVLMWQAAKLGMHVLVARSGTWIDEVVPREQQIDFRRDGASKVFHVMRKGMPLSCAYDYCYDETRSVQVPFLGSLSRTPTGILLLAKRYEYEVGFAGEDTSALVNVGSDVETQARIINSSIEKMIWGRPPEWLLWASVDRRWQAVDYERRL